MAKTLGKLRQQTLKLKELGAPSSVSKGTKNFVKKHVYVVHPDANENGDDVFKATNVKKYKRSPNHGYEPGEDEDIYEGRFKEIDIKRKDRFLDSVTMKKGRTRGEDLLGDHRASRHMEGQRLKDRMRSESTDVDKLPGRKNDGVYQMNTKKMNKALRRKDKGELLLKPSMQDPEQAASVAALDAKIGRAAEYMGHMAAKAKRDVAKKYWGVEGYEHIEAMTESDQALLVDTYNSLTEENQERFLEIAETEEGTDKLLDFAITQRVN